MLSQQEANMPMDVCLYKPVHRGFQTALQDKVKGFVITFNGERGCIV